MKARLVWEEGKEGMMREEELRRCLWINLSLVAEPYSGVGFVTMKAGFMELIPWFDATYSK